MTTDKMICKDLIGNEVYFDEASFGLTIVSVELRSHVSEQIKKSIQNPAMIIEISDQKRLYCLAYKIPQWHFFISHAILKEDKWHIEYHNLEYNKDKILAMINKDKKLFVR